MRAQHDALGKDVLAHLLEDEGLVEKEKVVAPKDSQRIDIVFTPDPVKRARRNQGQVCLRLIRRMTQRTCMFEVFSSALSETLVLLSQRKQISVLDELLVHARRKKADKLATPRPVMPVQWILSPTRPKRALDELGFYAIPDWPRGFYQGARGYKVWIVSLNELPMTRETLALRLLGTGRTRMDALTEIGAMSPDDPDRPVLLALLGWIRYVVRENRKAAERLSKEPDFMAVTREGFEQWMEKERQRADARIRTKAIREGKAMSLLAVLEARQIPVSAKLRSQIEACTDERLLDEWTRRAVTATKAREVFVVAN